jgi:ABC-2 type transport system ATP-binding protein
VPAPIIEAISLGKTFTTRVRPAGAKGLKALFARETRRTEAVKGISFSVEPGEFLAFIGPNGAGKSTTIKMLTGILLPSAGRASVLGMDPSKKRVAVNRRIGTVFGQKSQLWFHLPARDSLRLLGAVYEIEDGPLVRKIGELSELFSLGELLDVPVRKLSLGQRIRCEIAASLLHDPEIVFLDEPTIGLDVVAKQEVRALLTRMNAERGTTVFLTSHDAGDVEKVCKRAIIIHHGAVVLDQSVKELKYANLNRKIVSVKYSEPVGLVAEGGSGGPRLPAGARVEKATPTAARIEVDTRKSGIAEVLKALVSLGEVADITVEDEPMEEIIADIYRSRNEEEAHARAGRE